MLRLKIAEKIEEKSQRDGQNITATDVARAIGVSHNTILAYVRNETRLPYLNIMAKLARYFDCAIEELYEEVEDPELLAV